MITVEMIQAFLKHGSKEKPILSGSDLLLVNEFRDLKVVGWRKSTISTSYCSQRELSVIGFNIDVQDRSIWLETCASPKLFDLPISYLIEHGYLIPPKVQMYVTPKPGPHYSPKQYRRAYADLIVCSPQRNAMIVDLTEDPVNRGLRVVIDTGRTKQMRAISEALEAREVPHAKIHGQTSSRRRQTLLSELRSLETPCLVGTVLGEGIEIPELEVVINAEGLKSKVGTVQRMRNLTFHPDKKSVIMIDFAITHQAHLKRHSMARFETYTDHLGFDIRPVYPTPDGFARLPEEVVA
jgi:superfamily II DNA or RNA helicase